MGFSKGKTSVGGSNFNKLVGFSNCTVLDVNPNKERIKELTGREKDNEPIYLSEKETADGKQYKSLRLDFYVKPDSKNFSDRVGVLTLFVEDRNFINKDSTKAQVIDKYGRNKWLDRATIETHETVDRLDKDYKIAKRGQVELIDFLRKFLAIEGPEKYVTNSDGSKEWVLKSKEELALCESEISDWNKLMTGDVSEIKEILSFQKDNKVKLLFYVKVSNDGALYQGISNKEFLTAGASQKSFAKVQQRILENQAQGYGAGDIYEFCDLKEFVLEASSPEVTEESPADDLPFSDNANPDW